MKTLTLMEQLRKYAEQAVRDAKSCQYCWFGLCDYVPEAMRSLDKVSYGEGFTVGAPGAYCDYDDDDEETVVDVLAGAWLAELRRLEEE